MTLLHTIRLDDIDEIKLDNEEMEITTTVSIAIGDQGEVATYEDVTAHEDLPDYVRKAATGLSTALHRMLREKTHSPEALPCLTCRSACCYTEGVVRVTLDDLERLKGLGRPLDQVVKFYPEYEQWEGTDWAGYVGEMWSTTVPEKVDPDAYEDDAVGCMMVGPKGCSIYAHRPQVCRDYSPWTCGDTYIADPAKEKERAKGKFTLKVLPPGA
jgi:Fe-S-cluster containining protein